MRQIQVSSGELLEQQQDAVEVWVVQNVNELTHLSGVYFCKFRAICYINDWLQDVGEQVTNTVFHDDWYDIYVNDVLTYRLIRNYLRA